MLPGQKSKIYIKLIYFYKYVSFINQTFINLQLQVVEKIK